jgi:hypothetical protein
MVNATFLMTVHAVLSLIVLQNRVSGSQVNGFGTCSLNVDDLNRYGCGACCIML